jgi:lysophospholipid acyltransferase (LPLAT)-like uncharacterized protein
MKSWDRTQIPKPFTTIAMSIAEPMYVPRDADEPALPATPNRPHRPLRSTPAQCTPFEELPA